MANWILAQIVLIVLFMTEFPTSGANVKLLELEGPTFTSTPPAVTYFSNSLGTTLSCPSRGHPPITTTWLTANGDPVLVIPGLREILPNNSLLFGDFKPEDFSTSVHSNQYRCAISNPVGALLSPVFSIRAVVDQLFQVHISDSTNQGGEVIKGNAVILYCDVTPNFYNEFTRVVSWKTVDQFGYESDVVSDGVRYQVTKRGGVLVIFEATEQQLFVCVVQNVLNGKMETSSPFLVKPRAPGPLSIPPKSAQRWEQLVTVEVGKPAELFCPAIGHPAPTFSWFKYSSSPPPLGATSQVPAATMLGVSSSGVEMRGPLLTFSQVDMSQNGSYRCQVTNTVGSFVLDISLVVLPPTPVLWIEPKRVALKPGDSLELTCKISLGDPNQQQTNTNIQPIWFKNGKHLSPDSRLKISNTKLLVFNTDVGDQGMYQCFVAHGSYQLQAFSEIVFPASPPQLLETFIPQSLQPGPISLSFKCSATGNPVPEIRWFVDNQELGGFGEEQQDRFYHQSDRYSIASFCPSPSQTVSHINMSGLRIEDSGDYRCQASNLLRSVSHSARLNIFGPLFIRDMPSLTLIAGEPAFIPCMYGGYPADQILWRKSSKDLVTLRQQDGGNPVKNGKFTLLPNGTLKIDPVNSGSDKGQYTCVVSNRRGEVASGVVDVNVMRPPVISPFNFDENLVEGQRASITCNVMSGDLPINIRWLKDYTIIPPSLNITKERVKFLSYLIFEELSKEHAGTYTCSASNAAATSNYSATLVVKVAPKWVQEPPQLVRMVLKSDHKIQCSAEGVPKPRITWFRGESSGSRPDEIFTSQKYTTSPEGSLLIRNVDSSDAANYTCEASNGIGNSLKKSIQVFVNIPAGVSASTSKVIVAEGSEASLKCHIRGDRPIDVVWKKNSIILEPSPPRIETRLLAATDANSSVQTAELRIDQVQTSDSALYTCSAANSYGRDEDQLRLQVKERPHRPQDFMAEEVGSRFIRLRWLSGGRAESESGSDNAITFFSLQYKKSSTPSWTAGVHNTTVQSPARHAVLEGLEPVTHYDIRIVGANEFGHSLPSEPLAVLTLPEAPSAPPLNVSALPINPKSVVVRWQPPHPSFQHGAILGYHLLLTLHSSTAAADNYLHSNNSNNNNQPNNSTILVDEKTTAHHSSQVGGLRPNSGYRITVRAYNSAGMGPESPFVSVHTPEGAPDGPPENLRCDSLSPKSLQAQWDPPAAHLANGNILGYKVMYQPVFDERIGDKLEVKKTSNRETTLHGLQSFTNYSVRTLAFTIGGEGVLSPAVFCMTEEDVPQAPADFQVIATSPTSAHLSWLPPLSPNGRITKYTIKYWPSGAEESGAQEKVVIPASTEDEQLHLEIRKLDKFQRYSFRVTPSTGAGAGTSSRVETLDVTARAQPRVASFPVIRNVLADQPVTLPCRALGQGAKITWFRNGKPETSHHIMRNNSLFISRVKDQHEGIYTCRAESTHGKDEVQHRVVISRPPDAVTPFLGYVTSTSVQLHWEPPVPKTDIPIIGFVLEYQDENGIEWKSKQFNHKTSSVTLENLKCGTTYKFRVAAENAVGVGQFSDILDTKTNGNPPESPRLTDVLDGNGTMIRIDLSRWGDGGCPFNNFHIEYKIRDSVNWQRIYRADNLTKVFTFPTLKNVQYDVRISIENDAGSVMKNFLVHSEPEFFSNFGKVLERTEEHPGGDSGMQFTDPHVIVPIVSAIICTCAIAVCVLIVYKRRAQTKDEWKFSQGVNPQTSWLRSDESGLGGAKEGQENNYQDHREKKLSVYATLNSNVPIPMTIRDSTVRLHGLPQRDNYDAPGSLMTLQKKARTSSNSMVSSDRDIQEQYTVAQALDVRGYPSVHPLAIPQHLVVQSYPNHHHRQDDSDSEESDSLYANNYAKPYHHVGRINDTLEMAGKGTLRSKHVHQRRRISNEYMD